MNTCGFLMMSHVINAASYQSSHGEAGGSFAILAFLAIVAKCSLGVAVFYNVTSYNNNSDGFLIKKIHFQYLEIYLDQCRLRLRLLDVKICTHVAKKISCILKKLNSIGDIRVLKFGVSKFIIIIFFFRNSVRFFSKDTLNWKLVPPVNKKN